MPPAGEESEESNLVSDYYRQAAARGYYTRHPLQAYDEAVFVFTPAERLRDAGFCGACHRMHASSTDALCQYCAIYVLIEARKRVAGEE